MKFFNLGWVKAGIVIFAFVMGCISTTVYKNSEIKDLKLEYSQQENNSLKQAASELKENAESLNKAANNAQLNIGVANAKLSSLSKQIKALPPLPSDCVIPSERMRVIKESIDISNSP